MKVCVFKLAKLSLKNSHLRDCFVGFLACVELIIYDVF